MDERGVPTVQTEGWSSVPLLTTRTKKIIAAILLAFFTVLFFFTPTSPPDALGGSPFTPAHHAASGHPATEEAQMKTSACADLALCSER